MEKKTIEASLHQYYDRLASGICLIGMEPEEPILFVNKGLLRIYHCSDEADFYGFTGGQLRGMIDADDYHPISHLDKSAKANFISFGFRTRDDHFRQAEGTANFITLEDGRKVWLLQVISSEIKSGSTRRDPLTGLLGMRVFFEKALILARKENEAGHLSRYCPIYLNLTNFRLYNSIHGIAGGDRLLQRIAVWLRQCFPKTLISHLSVDSFAVMARKEEAFQNLEVVCARVNAFVNHPNILLKAGICMLDDDDIHIARHTFDMAKIACDSIKRDATRSWAVYTRDMGESLEKRDFVLENFDAALEKGYIKVYYQPVVRALTGKLCGMEALARWEDPVYGRLLPGVFIPVLENARLIHKLDCYVLQQITQQLHYNMVHHLPVLPISFNLSRYDFNLMDPFAVVEEAVRRYDLPRDYIRIEVTETALVKEKHNLVQSLRQFQDSGYQVWLDDFGSEYSSLNVLHNYHFDELKIDMAFLRNFNDESRKIITSIVLMAKTLGVHTLAEGAETKEQVDFLKAIGCEKIQGYYFGQPMSYEDCHIFCSQFEGGFESRLEEHIFDQAGLVNVVTDAPTAIFAYDGAEVRFLLRNRAYQKVLYDGREFSAHQGCEAVPAPLIQQRLHPLLTKAIALKRPQVMTYVDNGRYLRFCVEVISGTDGIYVGQASLYQMDYDQASRASRRADRLLRNVLQLYRGFYYFCPDQDTIEVLQTTADFASEGQVLSGIDAVVDNYARRFVYEEDQDRFREFMRFADLKSKEKTEYPLKRCTAFRIKEGDGSYHWVFFVPIPSREKGELRVLLGTCETIWESTAEGRRLLTMLTRSYRLPYPVKRSSLHFMQELCRSMAHYSDIKFFWKDKSRRFLGVSRAFLDYYGIEREADLIGKTDEDMGWHIDYHPYKEIEEAVLTKGAVVRNAPGQCIIGGRPRHIVATKFPIYRGRHIIGLVGYFDDSERISAQKEQLQKLNVIDGETSLLNFRGLLLAASEYVNNYHTYGQDYTCVILDVPEFSRIRHDYGPEIASKLLQQVKKKILAACPLKETLAYIGNCCFLFIENSGDAQNLRGTLQSLAHEVHRITRVDSCSCTLYLQYALAKGSEGQNFDDVLHILNDRLEDAHRQQYGEAAYVGDRLVFNREVFDSLDEEVTIVDPETYEVVYVNDAVRRRCGFEPQQEVRGKCYKILAGNEEPCPDCVNKELRWGSFYTALHHRRLSGQHLLMRTTLISWQGKDYRFTLATDLNQYTGRDLSENHVIFREVMANDVIAIGMREKDPEQGLQKMLAHIGHSLQAERVLIFEEKGSTVSATYEWHKEGLESAAVHCQHIPLDTLRPLYAAFDAQQMAIIEDAPAFARAHHFQPYLPNVHRLVVGHLVQSGKSLGFTEVINPSALAFKSAGLLLSTLTLFLAAMLRNRDTFRSLALMSTTDQLTGAGNRRGFTEYVKGLPAGTSAAFIYGDLNGLKKVNDDRGHEEGDKLLCKAVEIMNSAVGKRHVFRMGGDEFLVVMPDVNEKQTKRLLQDLRTRYRSSGVSIALGYIVRQAPIENLDEVLSEADYNMYRDKQRIYGTSRRDRRR